MQLIIDRLENDIAVCEYEEGKTLDLPRALLPAEAKEGDTLRILIDEQATKEQKNYAETLRNRLFHRDESNSHA